MKVDNFTVNCSRIEVINAIIVLDMRADKRGEIALLDGGIGAHFAVLELLSPGTYVGLTFWVQVFALPTNEFLYYYGR